MPRLEKAFVGAAALGMRRETRPPPPLPAPPRLSPEVEVADEVLVLGEQVPHDAEARARLCRVWGVGEIDDELPVGRRRKARIRLLAIRALGLPIRALREAEKGVVGLRVRWVAIPEVLVPHARLEIAEL